MNLNLKTRFVVRKDGFERELFSVAERKNGDLIIPLKHADAHESDGNVLIDILEQRYSVHRSPNSPGFTIKHTNNLKNNKKLDSSQFYLPGPDGLTALLFGKTEPDLSPSRYDLKPKKTDKIVRLYENDIKKSTLFFFLLVSESGCEIEPVKSSLKMTSVLFTHFRVTVLSGIFLVPAVNGADIMHFCTSVPRDNPENPPQYLLKDVPSSRIQQRVSEAEVRIPILAGLTAARHKKMIFNDEETDDDCMDELAQMLSIYLREPLP